MTDDEVKTRRLPKLNWWFGLITFLLGIICFIAFRFATFKSDNVHYHANFALYINDQRDEFKNFTFYEEVAACTSNNLDNPKTRVHMHDQNNGLVHVHAHTVTWAQFFDNLGYVLGDKLVETDNGVYVDGQNSEQLTFVLNGQKITDVANRVIRSEDRLLINYGRDDSSTITKHYDSVPTDAHRANTESDPATCSGSTKLTTWERLKESAGFSPTSH
ncbi:MAG TPA: hypothetical protein VLF39_00835 [Candidatus Saccharimonadales bacterium]|nr:hypothetical protein [Candidatus Saccharimonadales bacterium]